ncbi:MAG: dihydrolipoamide acetyltransferase family protein [Chitinophagales bacterium]|jgi:2-oxoglutarate dehydrogenase E2 component (dihydrolipoamide succinyltransferase)|nr:2-oxo acid dehydrogenase subunit E2 [Bacteroidota bacterium]MBK9554344.1 2-oxo acid dehydrogenase subunit E2 [Bacteroidota bacterium]MBL0280048.1 2-oxo acid dehydrogenase subunit E2 [Bacteroidota bacterium]MBP9880308.1 2-oxo acid dehydrogenase subunit E2 [Chitinophagales bacterium]
MSQKELIMPKLGESIMEATILKWLKKEGDSVELDEAVLEIATDKVDSEVPSPFAGKITSILFKEGDVVQIGKAIAIIDGAGNGSGAAVIETPVKQEVKTEAPKQVVVETKVEATPVIAGDRFYSPLVLNIAREEGISMSELERIPGTGKDDRVTKSDILNYLQNRGNVTTQQTVQVEKPVTQAPVVQEKSSPVVQSVSSNGNNEIVEMDRMRKLIADHMVMSKKTSPHVTSYVEVDMTPIVEWRNKIKPKFEKREGQKITFTPIFIEAIAKAIKDFPGINISVDGYNLIYKKDINIGMAAALPTGNLIVPVIKNADRMNLVGLTAAVNDYATRARINKLKPDEIQDGTFTLTNVGSFGSLMGTPIINQPQVAILAVGAIKKKPVVLETVHGDVIAIRHMMFMSMSYDHRVVDGMLGGSFLKRVADYLEGFDTDREI